jgi:DNA primase
MRNVLSGFSRVIVLADNDDSGQGLAFGEMIAEQLDEVKIVLAPKGHDVNSTLKELGPAGLRSHFGVDKHSD